MINIPVESLHTTALGKERIKRNLGLKTNDIIEWCKQAVFNANEGSIIRKGKNWYVYGDDYVLTINAYSNTVITAHKLV
jgi:hypothetical protein